MSAITYFASNIIELTHESPPDTSIQKAAKKASRIKALGGLQRRSLVPRGAVLAGAGGGGEGLYQGATVLRKGVV